METLVYEQFLDLSIIFIVRQVADSNGFLCTKVTKQLIESWGITPKDLRDKAFRNMRNEGYSFMDMQEVLCKQLDYDGQLIDEMVAPGKMMVLTNKNCYWGAVCIADSDLLAEKLGEKNYYILPSSIHEVIAVDDDGKVDAEQFSGMINDVNNGILDRESVLAGHSYYYDGKKQELRVCA